MLKDVVPYTETGRPGNTSILDEANVQQWVMDNARRLLDAGYVRVVVTDHVPSRIVGDRRARRA